MSSTRWIPQEITALDILEKVPLGVYKREGFKVVGEDGGWYTADLYRVVKPEGPYTPAKKYVSWMIEGMKEHKIDPVYAKRFIDLYPTLPETSEIVASPVGFEPTLSGFGGRRLIRWATGSTT